MILVLLGAAVALLALPGLVRPAARGLEPTEWARVCVAAVILGLLSLEVGLLGLAAPTVLRSVGVVRLASLCEQLLGRLAPGGAAVGWVAVALALVLPVRSLRRVRRARALRRSARVDDWFGEHRSMDDCDLVIVPAAQPVAFSVHGQPDQVVVSRGLLDCLSPAEVDAVLAHEASHLRHNHHRYLLVASALEGALGFVPAVRSSASALRTALERWADEAAARECPEGRPIVRRALLRASGFASMPDVAAFNGADDVMERAQALARDPWTGGWRRRMASYTPVAALSLAAVTATWTWLGQAGAVAAMAGMCGARL